MKRSDIPTPYLMIKAITNSEWDCCDFAIIFISEDWKKEQQKRLENIKPFSDDYMLISMMYCDQSITFFKDDNEICPDSTDLLEDRIWSFVELNEETRGKLSVPENRITYQVFHVLTNGFGYYQAVGKHTSEEFWTAKFPLEKLIKNNTNLTN
ncbi:hypothetical protein DRF65_16460 [Chryseobacterium pennae]|uniref:Uncharacterized protein n=1 Tax=Chryseobacterium pennae TaxID=2258962 RepID=A0A3D9C6H9_9FLAO|nr:hypothetical protein [Chryseobacterium pennae]REC61349.1 hypothetical protein DRF65_16460 [Chryseobacterium pennae]